jgi:hypothetical protein
MRFSLIVMLASAYARASFGGTLEIIDIDNQCAIWSYDNHGCTGSSAFFSQLDGDDCSSKLLPGMQIKKNLLMNLQGWTRSPTALIQVTLCVAQRLAARKTIHQLHGLRSKITR